MVAVRNTTTSCHYLRRLNIEAIHNIAGICNGFQCCREKECEAWLRESVKLLYKTLRGEIADISQEAAEIREAF